MPKPTPSWLRALRSTRGFNLVVLTMLITVLTIMVGAMLPLWSHQIERDKEEELIFRGLQYAEAIRVFQQRVNRLPVRLEELIETRPRSIRQLWKNPMREDGAWALVPATAGPPATPPQRPPGGDGRQAAEGEPVRPAEVIVIPGGDALAQPSGPFRGVYNPGSGEAVKTFFGSNELSEWRFTVDLVTAGRDPSGRQFIGDPRGIQLQIVNSGTVGRPFPPGVTPPNQPGGNLNPPGRGGREQTE